MGVIKDWGLGWEKWTDIGQKVQTFIYKVNKCWASNTQQGGYTQEHCPAYLKVAETVDLKRSHHTPHQSSNYSM